MPNLAYLTPPHSLDVGKNSDGGISNFRIPGQFFIKENYHNSRTSDDIDMKLGPVTKLDKRNKTTSKNDSKQTPKIPTQIRVTCLRIDLKLF